MNAIDRPSPVLETRATSLSAAWIGILAVLVALAGCGKRDHLLARVGTETITARDLEGVEIHMRRDGGDASPGDPRTAFNTLVTRALLLEAARDIGRAGILRSRDSLPANGSPSRSPELEQ